MAIMLGFSDFLPVENTITETKAKDAVVALWLATKDLKVYVRTVVAFSVRGFHSSECFFVRGFL